MLVIKEALGVKIGYIKLLFLYLSSGESLKTSEQYQSLKNMYYNVLNNYRVLANELHNKNTGEIINGKGTFNLLPILPLNMLANLNSFPLIEELLNKDNQPAFTREEIIFSFENIMNLILNNISLLNDAYYNMHSELQSIVDNYEILKAKDKI